MDKMKILKFKALLFTFVGIFLYISHMMLYREITASSAYPFFASLFFLLFLTFWTGVGILLSPFKQDQKPHFLFPLLCIAPASLLSLIAIQLLAACYPIQNYANLALVALLGCFPLGTTFGIMLISAKRSVSPHLQKHVAFFGAMGYFATGFVLYPLALFNVLANPIIYTFASNTFILIVALAIFKFKRANSIKYWFLTFATLLIALNFSLLQLEKYTARNFFTTRYPDWQLVKPYLTHYGRITLLSQKKSKSGNRFMLLKNTQIQQIIPEGSQLYKTAVIPFSLQPNKKDLRALAIGSPFSFIPTILSSLPYVKHVTHIAPGIDDMPLTVRRYFTPPPSLKMSMINADTNKYLKDNKKKFDLIIWLSSDLSYLNFDSMLRHCASSLNKDGVLAVPASLLAVNNAQNTCTKMFKNKISIPGKSFIYAFSNTALTSNLNILEKRLEKLEDIEAKIFPPGTFSILYSIPRKTPVVDFKQNKSDSENILIKSFSSSQINLRHILIILAFSFVYFTGRFFLLRRKRLQAATGLFENGLCLMLLMMILMTLFAQREGAFYYNFGVVLATISGAPMGLFFSQFKLRRLAVIMSVVVIFLSTLHLWEYQSSFIPGITYINFLCGGVIIANIFKQNPDSNIKLLSIHFLACALGAAIMFSLLIMHFSLLSSLVIVILFRIPLIFSRMALGKLDTSEANNV
jgi:hypothetical protein